MTVLASGINMFAMAKVFQLILGWSMDWSILVSALVVLPTPFWAAWLKHLQRGLAVLSHRVRLRALVTLGVIDVGGWNGLVEKMPPGYAHAWSGLGSASSTHGHRVFGMIMAWASCFPSVTGARTSWWCNARWPPRT